MCFQGFPGDSAAKNLPANAEDAGHKGPIPGSGRSPGGGNGNPLQYSCLGNSIDRRAWLAAVHGIAKSGHDVVTEYTHVFSGVCQRGPQEWLCVVTTSPSTLWGKLPHDLQTWTVLPPQGGTSAYLGEIWKGGNRKQTSDPGGFYKEKQSNIVTWSWQWSISFHKGAYQRN